MFSIRIVDADFYVTEPKPELDISYSKFRESKVTRVPVVRIFGSTPSGQKTCIHVHQVFPYIFVPYDGTEPRKKYLKQFANSVDFAVQVAMGKATSATHHVYKTEIVKRIPFYGYYEVEHEFIKIQFYNPRTIAMVVDLLQNGAILNKIFQPYESHIPYILQFLIDFNLYGMNFLHAKTVHFRGWCKILEKKDSQRCSPNCFSSCTPNGSSSSSQSCATSCQQWNENTIPSDLCLGASVAKTSRCELEVDVIAENILNKLEIETSIGCNPGIAAMWEDEKQRRRDHGQSSQITIPVSQDRGVLQLLDLETKFKINIREIILQRNEEIQSQLEIMEKSLSPEEFQQFSQSILLDGKESFSQPVLSEDVDESIPIVDQSVIEDVLQASQSQSNIKPSGHCQVDENLVEILMSLAEDPNEATPQECSPNTNTTQMVVPRDKEADSDEENDDEESIMMSQPVWNDDDDFNEDCENSSLSADEVDVEDWKSQRIPRLDVSAGDDVEECGSSPCLITKKIPQLDGCHDDSDESSEKRIDKKKISGKDVGNGRISKTNKTNIHRTKTALFKCQDIDAGDEGDFQTKKRAFIHGTKNNICISKTRREMKKQRKTAVRSGNFNKGSKSSHESCTNVSDGATKKKRYLPLVGSGSEEVNCCDEKFRPGNSETCLQSSFPPSTDGETLYLCSEAEKKTTMITHKNGSQTMLETINRGAHFEIKDLTEVLKDDLYALEIGSSESQTSDFELRLSVSSSDDEDFQCRNKIPKIAQESHKLESLYVVRKVENKSKTQAEDSLKNRECKARSSEESVSQQQHCMRSMNSKIIFKKRKSRVRKHSGTSKKIKSKSPRFASISGEQRHLGGEAYYATCLEPGESPGKSSKECSGNNSESRKRKRGRSKKATCLEFTRVGVEARSSEGTLSKTDISCVSGNCRFPETGNDKTEMNSKLSATIRNTKTAAKECHGNLEDRRRVEKENKHKVYGKRILLDACVKLEKLSVKKLKSQSSATNILERYRKLRDKSRNVEDRLINDELDSLYEMAMLSPKSCESGVESPPRPSSPSFNVISSDQALASVVTLDEELSKGKIDPEVEITRNSPELSSNEINDQEEICLAKATLKKDFGFDENHSLKQVTEDFPIVFISEEEVNSIVCQSGSTSESRDLKELNSTLFANSGNYEEMSLEYDKHHKAVLNHEYTSFDANAVQVVANDRPKGSPLALSDDGNRRLEKVRDTDVSPKISVVYDSFNVGSCMDVKEHETEVCMDMGAVRSGIPSVSDSFGINDGDDLRGMNVEELMKDIGGIMFDAIGSSQKNNIEDSDNSIVFDGRGSSRDKKDETDKLLEDVGSFPVFESEGMIDIQRSPVLESRNLAKERNSDVHEMVNDVGKSPLLEGKRLVLGDNIGMEEALNDVERCRVVEGSRLPKQNDLQFFDHFEKSDIKIWKPASDPPSLGYILKTRDLYSLPHERHWKAFCSDPKDVPLAPRVVGGRRLQVSSLSVDELTEFDLNGNFQTLRELRGMMASDMDDSLIRDCLRTLVTHGDNSDINGYTDIPRELKVALMGEQKVVITPIKQPPSPKDIEKWLKGKRTGNQLMSKPSVIEEQRSQEPRVNKFPNELEDLKTRNFQKSENGCNAETPVSKSRDFVHLPNFSDSTLMQDISEKISRDVLGGPQHSTPLGNTGMKSGKFWPSTPIERHEMNEKLEGFNQDLKGKISRNENHCKINSLRRNILNSQVKEQDSQDKHQQSYDASYIEGPTPTNSFGFKISQPNIQVAKSVRQVQYLTLLSVEVHVRTRKSLRPDPEFDAICAIFCHIEHETEQGKEYVTAVIVVRNESTKLRRSDTAGTSDIAEGSLGSNNTSSSMQTLRGNSDKSVEDSLLRPAGISNEMKIISEDEETDAINRFIKLVHDWDPDILLGFEVQMLSWGYILQRATALGIDIAPQLSRVQDSSSTARFDAGSDQWGARHTSEISITGRIVLNVWRLMRHEVTLNIYSFENISYHVLHERVPLYTYQKLTRWWDQMLPHDRWRTVEHYVIRCQGNIRILNHVDFINRTSEFARLYGILFYSVISRGSQFRVESMMLRLAKPMNYLAVSPSIQQRARMDAPECIALVMEPESRFYSDPVIVLDFQSLYPSMIIAYNYCYSTCLGKVSRLDKIGKFDFGCTALNVPPALLEKLEDDIHVSANGAAFVKSNVRRGILPRMLEEILDTRVMVKKSMKEYKNDKVLGQLLDARQLALKLIANVTYGYTSANFSGRMPCVEIADAIVRKARETLERAIQLVNSRNEWGARVVYGDTDSLFVLVKGATKEEAFQIGHEIVDAVTAENPKPVKLKFEKVYLPCVLQTKKRYVGYMYETLEQKAPVFDAKGIETVRRDTCPAVAKILEKSLRILFEEKDLSLVKKFVQRQFCKLMEERVSIQDFIFAKEYRGMKSYKPKACVPALELARRQLSRDRRAEPRVGERVPYVVVNGSPGLPLIQLVRSPGDVLEDPSLRLNASYYINKQIIPPLNRVFSLIGVDVLTWYTELPRFVPRHRVTAGKPKSSISRYFTTLHCPVCEQLTQQGLCHACRDNAQTAVTILAERVGNWERKFAQLTEICLQCCGTRNMDIPCISLDCPVMFKRIKMRRKLEYGETLRDVQNSIEISNS